MTLGVLGLAGLLGLPLLIGWLLVRWLAPGLLADGLAAVGLAYLAGALSIGLALSAWLAAGMPLDPRALSATLALVGAALWIGSVRRGGMAVSVRPRRSEWPLFAAVAIALALALARGVEASRRPVLLGDESLIFADKAKILFDVGEFGEPLVARVDLQRVAHFDYPSLDSLLQLWSFVLAGQILFVENRFLVQLAGLSLVCLLAAGLRRQLRPVAAGALLFLVAAAPATGRASANCGADLMTAVGLLAAVEFGLRWLTTEDAEDLRALALSLAFLVWCKNEGMLYALALVGFLLARRRRGTRPRGLTWLVLPALIALGTWAFNGWHGFSNDVVGLRSGTRLVELAGERWPLVLGYMGRLLFLEPQVYHYLFALLVAALAAHPRALGDRRLSVTVGVVAAALLGQVLVYLQTPQDLEWHLDTSARRIVFHLLPAAVLGLARAAALHPWLGARFGRSQEAETAHAEHREGRNVGFEPTPVA